MRALSSSITPTSRSTFTTTLLSAGTSTSPRLPLNTYTSLPPGCITSISSPISFPSVSTPFRPIRSQMKAESSSSSTAWARSMYKSVPRISSASLRLFTPSMRKKIASAPTRRTEMFTRRYFPPSSTKA